MKLMAKILDDFHKPKIKKVELVLRDGRLYQIDPIMSDELACKKCNLKKMVACMVNPQKDPRYCAFCVNPDCLSFETNLSKSGRYVAKKVDSVSWPVFCDLNGIGDIFHEVSFEKCGMTLKRRNFFNGFIENPSGVLLFMGKPGRGKTYTALSIVQKFIQQNGSALFLTQDQFTTKVLSDPELKATCINCSLLVLDDFGITPLTASQHKCFFEIMNSRLQWSNRGTIITTCSDDESFASFCGEALIDRIRQGKKILFDGESKRN